MRQLGAILVILILLPVWLSGCSDDTQEVVPTGIKLVFTDCLTFGVWVFVEESACPFSVRIPFPRQNQATVSNTGHQNHSGITVPFRKILLRPCREASRLDLRDALQSSGEFLVNLAGEQPALVRQAPFPQLALLADDAQA